jgi:hypothetical protein
MSSVSKIAKYLVSLEHEGFIFDTEIAHQGQFTVLDAVGGQIHGAVLLEMNLGLA